MIKCLTITQTKSLCWYCGKKLCDKRKTRSYYFYIESLMEAQARTKNTKIPWKPRGSKQSLNWWVHSFHTELYLEIVNRCIRLCYAFTGRLGDCTVTFTFPVLCMFPVLPVSLFSLFSSYLDCKNNLSFFWGIN